MKPTLPSALRSRLARTRAGDAAKAWQAQTDTDDESLLKACTEGASAARPLFTAYLLAGAYIAVTVGGVTDVALFYGMDFNLPVIDATLPLRSFFALAPVLFFLLHLWLMLHAALVAENLHALMRRLSSRPEDEREHFRQRLENFTLIHALALREATPFRWLLGLVNFATLVLFPLAILLLVQIVFLPYHSPLVWLHRGLVLADVMLLSYLWPIIVHGDPRTLRHWWRVGLPAMLPGRRAADGTRRSPGLGLVLAAGLSYSAVGATYPGDGWDRVLYPPPVDASPDGAWRAAITERASAMALQDALATDLGRAAREMFDRSVSGDHSLSWWRRRPYDELWLLPIYRRNLNLDNQVLSLGGRAAFLTGHADPAAPDGQVLEIADRDFSHASFRGAVLRQLALVDVTLNDADMTGATLDRVAAHGCRAKQLGLDTSALVAVSFSQCMLSGANFVGARLDGVTFDTSNLIGASFLDAELTEAHFSGDANESANGFALPGDLGAVVIDAARGGLVTFDNVLLDLADIRLGGAHSSGDAASFDLAVVRQARMAGATIELGSRAARCVDWNAADAAMVDAPSCGRELPPDRRDALTKLPARPIVSTPRIQGELRGNSMPPHPATPPASLSTWLATPSQSSGQLLAAVCVGDKFGDPPDCNDFQLTVPNGLRQIAQVGRLTCDLLAPNAVPWRMLDRALGSTTWGQAMRAELARLDPVQRRRFLEGADGSSRSGDDDIARLSVARRALSLLSMQAAVLAARVQPPAREQVRLAIEQALSPCVGPELRAQVAESAMRTLASRRD